MLIYFLPKECEGKCGLGLLNSLANKFQLPNIRILWKDMLDVQTIRFLKPGGIKNVLMG